MAKRKYYIGDVGPLFYDDAKTTSDPAFGGLPFHSFLAEKQGKILETPFEDDQILRYQDMLLGGLFPVDEISAGDSPHAVGDYDFYHFVDASAGPVVLTFPSAILTQSNSWVVKKIDSTANAVTITPFGAQTVDGAASYVITEQNSAVRISSDGTNLQLISDFGEYSKTLEYIGGITKDPTGFPSTWETDTAITWTDAAPDRTFSIQPTGTSFTYYHDGVMYTSTGDTVQITDTSGGWFIYYDGATLTASQAITAEQFIKDYVAVGFVYWNATDGASPLHAVECHGLSMASDTHYHLHEVFGAKYQEGLTLSGYTEDTYSDAALQFAVTAGEFHDEDISVEISNGGGGYWSQTLSPTASCPLYYKIGTIWTHQAPSTLPYILGDGGVRLAYNLNTLGTWTKEDVTSNKFVNYFLIATNDIDHPVAMVMGIEQYLTSTAAEDAATSELVSIGDLLGPEAVYLYTITLQAKTGGGGTYNAQITNVTDLRLLGLSTVVVSAAASGDHATQSNLDLASAGHTYKPSTVSAVSKDLQDIKDASPIHIMNYFSDTEWELIISRTESTTDHAPIINSAIAEVSAIPGGQKTLQMGDGLFSCKTGVKVRAQIRLEGSGHGSWQDTDTGFTLKALAPMLDLLFF